MPNLLAYNIILGPKNIGKMGGTSKFSQQLVNSNGNGIQKNFKEYNKSLR